MTTATGQRDAGSSLRCSGSVPIFESCFANAPRIRSPSSSRTGSAG